MLYECLRDLPHQMAPFSLPMNVLIFEAKDFTYL